MPDDTVRISWIFNATKLAVWNAWTNPDTMKLWFGSDPNGKGISAKVDLREGGEYEVTFQNSDGSEYTCFGEYMEVRPLEKLAFTWAWRNRPEKVELVSLIFIERLNATEMLFEHKAIDEGTSHDYENGWNRTFTKLESLITSNF